MKRKRPIPKFPDEIEGIPCEICQKIVPFESYGEHTARCSIQPPRKKMKTSGSSFSIPCDFPGCGKEIRLDEFTAHVNSHRQISNTTNRNGAKIITIPCDYLGCNEHIPLSSYDTHQNKHRQQKNDEEIRIPCTYPNCKKLILPDFLEAHKSSHEPMNAIPCDFPGCKKMIPIEEYQKHQFSHQNQSNEDHKFVDDGIPCDFMGCNCIISFQDYETHKLSHLKQQQNAFKLNATTATSISNQILVPAPKDRSALHPLHKLLPPHSALPITKPLIREANYLSLGFQSSWENSIDEDRCVEGLIPALRKTLSSRNHLDFHLCDAKTKLFWRGREDWSYGCGFRNLQNMTSCLTNYEVYKKQLYNGSGVVPKISAIQKMMDYAHHQGWDPTGFREIGSVSGSKKWIGAVDITALLRSFGLPAVLVDFEKKTKQGDSHDVLFQWVWNYFTKRVATKSKGHKYFAPPIFFQHQGHSRTIIGILRNKRTEKYNLLVFDPSVKGGARKLLENIKSGKYVQVQRSLKQTKRSQYQLVYLPVDGILQKEDYKHLKLITSEKP